MGNPVSGFNNNVLSADAVLKVFQASGLEKMTRNEVLERIPAAIEQVSRFGRRGEILNKISASLNYLAEKKGLLIRAGLDEDGRQFWALKERMGQAAAEAVAVEVENSGASEPMDGDMATGLPAETVSQERQDSLPLEVRLHIESIKQRLMRPEILPVDNFHAKLQLLAELSAWLEGPCGEMLEDIAGDLIDFNNQAEPVGG
jgi:hypothetical protein